MGKSRFISQVCNCLTLTFPKKKKVAKLIEEARYAYDDSSFELAISLLDQVSDTIGANKLEAYLEKHSLSGFWGTWMFAHRNLAERKEMKAHYHFTIGEIKEAKKVLAEAVNHLDLYNSRSNEKRTLETEKELSGDIERYEMGLPLLPRPTPLPHKSKEEIAESIAFWSNPPFRLSPEDLQKLLDAANTPSDSWKKND